MAAEKYDTIKEHLDKAKGKKMDMQKDIQTLKDDLNIINRGEISVHKKNFYFNWTICLVQNICCWFNKILNSLFDSDHIGALLKQAKDAVQAANKTVNNDTARLSSISKELDKIKIPSGDSNVDNILNSINKTCEILQIFQKFTDMQYIQKLLPVILL